MEICILQSSYARNHLWRVPVSGNRISELIFIFLGIRSRELKDGSYFEKGKKIRKMQNSFTMMIYGP